MKSIQTKFLTVVISVSLLIAITTTLISFIYTRSILHKDSDVITESVANTETLRINTYLREIEYSVSSMQNYIMSTIKYTSDLNNKDERDAYADDVQKTFLAMVNNLDGIASYYLRFAPEVSDSTSGFFVTKTLDDASLHEVEPTDLAGWENARYEEVCWFSEPRKQGKAIWLEPYLNPKTSVNMISYACPLYANSKFIGVVGVDVEFAKIEEMVTEVSVYDNGFAYLSDNTLNHVYFSPVDEHQLNKAHSNHGFAEEHKALANGMTLVIHADYSDIQRDSYNMTLLIVGIVSLLLIIFILITWILTKKITNPLRELTYAAEKLADGDVDINLDKCITKDEIGILASAFKKTIEQLRGYMKYINALAYKDALTGIKNRTAYNEASTELDVKIRLGECEPFAILAADVNDLKKTNDKYGHEIGNKLLVKSAKAICDVFKRSPVYRIGGDEFIVILRGEDYENHTALLCELDEKLSKTFITIGEDCFNVSIARAIATFKNDADVSFEDVFNRADKRMYEHKASTRNAIKQ